MARKAVLAIDVISDTSAAERGLGRLEGGLGGLKKGALIAGAAIATIGAAAGALIWDAIGSAGELEQSVGAVDAVFKDNAGQVHKWADGAARDVGLAKNEYNELATLIGSQLKNGGTAMDELGSKTNDLIGVGSDLSAMFGGTTADAVGALSSALKGERDPIERYGVSLNQAAIDAKAAELGFEKVGGALTAEANQAATLALIMEQTSDAHGAFGRESDTLAHKQQVFAAELENAKAALGEIFLPIATAVFGFLSDTAIPAIQGVIDHLRPLGDHIQRFLGGLESGAGDAGRVLDTIRDVAGRVAGSIRDNIGPAFERAGDKIREWIDRVRPIIDEITQFVLGKFDEWAPRIGAIFDQVTGLIGDAIDLIVSIVDIGVAVLSAQWDLWGATILEVLGYVWDAAGAIVENGLGVIRGLIQTVTGLITGDWSKAWDGIKTIFRNAQEGNRRIVEAGLNILLSITGKIGGLIRDAAARVWSAILGNIRSSWSTITGTVRNALGTVRSVLESGWNAARTTVSNAWSRIRSAVSTGISSVVSDVRGLPGRAVSAMGNLGSRLYGAGMDLIRGMINGVRAMAGRLASSARNVVSSAVSAARNALGIRSPSRVFRLIGEQTADGLILGLNALSGDVERAGRDLAAAAVPDIEIPAPRLATGTTTGAGAGNVGSPTYVFNISGALDPRAVAEQIRSLLNTDARTRGVTTVDSLVFA